MEALNKDRLEQRVGEVLAVSAGGVTVRDPAGLRDGLVDDLVITALFGGRAEAVRASWLIRAAAEATGAVPSSIQAYYDAMGRGEVAGLTVPAVNLRTLTYDLSRAVFRAARRLDAGAFIFEIARSEIGYTFQTPIEYSTVVLAAAIREGHAGPVFIQGDHFQVSAKNHAKDPAGEIASLEELIRKAVNAGFYNIDIDASTVVDLGPADLVAQQKLNFEITARLVELIRRIEPAGITVSVGAEIGEVGGRNSTVEDFRAFMQGLGGRLRAAPGTPRSISKISVQTGTSHGGVPRPDGTIAEVKLDFGVLQSIGKVARAEYGLCGSVQHGASTLPEELFDRFPGCETGEIHLATGFQNLFYDHPAVPAELTARMADYTAENFAAEKKAKETQAQFLYKARKKALGPFKREIWGLPREARDRIGGDMEERIVSVMRKLGVAGSARQVGELVKRVVHVPPADVYERDFEYAGQPATSTEGE